jgi:methionyl-tRNA formyltransferase
MLPKYKGMYTSAWPILNGEFTSGVTLHEIDHGIDTGAIVGQLEFPIKGMSCRDLYLGYMENALSLFKLNFRALLSDETTCASQSTEGASYYSKASIQFNKLRLNFNVTAFQVVQQFQAYSFRQFQLPKVEDVEFCQIRILKARSFKKSGTIIRHDAECIIVSTVDFDVELKIDYLEELISLCRNSPRNDIAELLARVTDVNEFGRQGWTPSMVAAYYNNIEAVQLLVESEADLNASNCNGTTVLMYAKDGAERAKDTSVLKWLLDAGADTAMRDQRGKTVMDYCMENDETRSLNIINQYIS